MPPSNKSKSVPVLDYDEKILSYTTAAKARVLLKKNKALVHHTNPFVIQLTDGESEEQKMAKVKPSMLSTSITNFTKFFQEEREIYIQNLSSTQISLTFPTGSGQDFHFTVPATRKPYNLTQFVPFDLIKTSGDLRKIVNRRPPILRFIEEDDFNDYYIKLAERNGTSIDEEFGKSQALINRLIDKPRLASDRLQREAESLLEEKMEALESPPEINPRVIGLCAKADKENGIDRLQANDFLEELEALSDSLTVDDWEFAQTKAPYKTVKTFCAKMVDKLTESELEE